MGPVHTTVLSSEHDLSPNSPQYMWLQDDLRAVDRSRTPWLVVEAHRPMYQGEAIWAQNDVGIGMRFEFEDLLYDFQVDLFLSGHYHSYFRTCDGLYRSRCNNGGPTHITTGTAGAQLDMAGLYWNWWTAKYVKGHYGYGRITIMNSTALHFELVKAGDVNDTSAGDTLDDVWIIRHR
jgi:acid phosphatase type 7